jgi:hypothetical protein
MSQTCEAKRIQQNSAQAVVDQATAAYTKAKTDYNSCLGPEALGSSAMADATPAMDKINKEVQMIYVMEQFILKQLGYDVNNEQTLSSMTELANDQSDRLQKEIDALKADIRTERRKFLDASPSATTAVAGLYFTQQPDNQLLIAFLLCFGAFLLFTGLLVIMGLLPIYAFQVMTTGERVKVVGTVWALSVGLMYLGFFTFT